jgi:hypothetical protein
VAAKPSVLMSEDDLEEAVLNSIWYPACPSCKSETPAEPDARQVVCQTCELEFDIHNLYF